MSIPDIETRLKQAAVVSGAPRSIVDDVMRQLPASIPKRAPRFARRHLILIAGAALSGVAAIVAFIVFVAVVSARVSFADVEVAVDQQAWVHIRYDAGQQVKESWLNLKTGEDYSVRFDGSVVYVNEQDDVRLWYWKGSGVIYQDTPIIYAPGEVPHPQIPHTAWDAFVAYSSKVAAATQPVGSHSVPVVSVRDTLGGKPVIRFDSYLDGSTKRFLYSQLWVDPTTHLPVRIKTLLQNTEGKGWSTGDFDFPHTGPEDLYALGVPRNTPVHKQATTAPSDVQPVLEAIHRNYESFLKHYRAVDVLMSDAPDPMSVDIIWRDGDSIRDDHHLPLFEMQTKQLPYHPLPTTNPADIVPLISSYEATEQQLAVGDRSYLRSAAATKAAKPQVRIILHGIRVYMNSNGWPEFIQWPTQGYGLDFNLIEPNSEGPPGCIGLRHGGQGNDRDDYYVDPQNDYVCVKHIRWEGRDGRWVKAREYLLLNLHRVQGRVVAGIRQTNDFGNPDEKIYPCTYTDNISVTPLEKGDYPPRVFDPASITNGAEIINY